MVAVLWTADVCHGKTATARSLTSTNDLKALYRLQSDDITISGGTSFSHSHAVNLDGNVNLGW